jgi:hypothetical protein
MVIESGPVQGSSAFLVDSTSVCTALQQQLDDRIVAEEGSVDQSRDARCVRCIQGSSFGQQRLHVSKLA